MAHDSIVGGNEGMMSYRLPDALRRLKIAAQMDPPDDRQRGLGMFRKVDVRDLQVLIYHFEQLENADRKRYNENAARRTL